MNKLRIFYPALLLSKENNEIISFKDYQIEASGSIIEHNIFNDLTEELKNKILFNEIYPEIIFDTLSSSLFLSCILIFKKDIIINTEEALNEIISLLESDMLKNKFIENELFLASDLFHIDVNKKQKELISIRND